MTRVLVKGFSTFAKGLYSFIKGFSDAAKGFPSLLPLFAIAGAAFCLRIGFTILGPIQPLILQDLADNYAQLGLLATVPQLCAGLFSFSIPFLLRYFNPPVLPCLGLGLMALMATSIFIERSFWWLAMLFALVGVGVALTQTGLQASIKLLFDGRRVKYTAIMIAAMHAGSAFTALTSVPIAHTLGDWRAALGFFAIVIAAMCVLWFAAFAGRFARHRHHRDAAPVRLSTPQPVLVAIVLYFLGSGIIYISLLIWLPDYYRNLGWSDERAASMLAVYVLAQCAAAVFLVLFGRDHWNKRAWLAFATTLCLVGVVAAAKPTGFGLWALPICTGLGLGLSFALAMSLPLDYGQNPRETGFISMLALGIGSTLCAPFPFAIGWLKDNVEIANLSLWIIAAAGVMMLVCTRFFRAQHAHHPVTQ